MTGGIALDQGNLVATAAGALGPNTNAVTFGGGNLELRSASKTYTALLNMATSGGLITINPASSGNGLTDTIGKLAIGSQQFSPSAGTPTTNNTAYGLTVGDDPLGIWTLHVANNGTGVGTLTLCSE